ncbi:polysaccharide deacetylase [Anaerobacillus alkalidiazotrophicus]|uniref:Polysaccharide deacetylase n=1 Tax=Anaerobacillus alkalidiazotrophicus TaxID=472963 RepID=A0A1S2LZH4_9BACI|nr:polysaccharide deacetylase family protein [Anaerobacillus alkalidiazotrophicus]OIJ17694.1 polysaccharide deacetylase [Anaerobacillus alkalidiazotrophicus]
MKKYPMMIVISILLLVFTGCTTEVQENQKINYDREMEIKEYNGGEIVEADENLIEEEIGTEVNEIEEHSEKKDEPLYILNDDHTVSPMTENVDERVVLLTIDDAPDHYSLEMARFLKEKEINAIFFVNGHFINNEKGREKLLEIYELGFAIGNHTMTHPNLKDLPEEKQREQIVQLNDMIEEIIGERPRFFRAPFGVNTEISRKVVEKENMQWMNWTYGYDYFSEYMEKEPLVDIMINTELLRPGANLLMHDRKWTLEALPGIIEGLEERGYGFVNPHTISKR